MKTALAKTLRLLDISSAIFADCDEELHIPRRVFTVFGSDVCLGSYQCREHVALRSDAAGFRRHETRRHCWCDSRTHLSAFHARPQISRPANGGAASGNALG